MLNEYKIHVTRFTRTSEYGITMINKNNFDIAMAHV